MYREFCLYLIGMSILQSMLAFVEKHINRPVRNERHQRHYDDGLQRNARLLPNRQVGLENMS